MGKREMRKQEKTQRKAKGGEQQKGSERETSKKTWETK